MIGFIDTSLQLQSIITAHTLNSFWTTSVWRVFMKNLSLISDWSLLLSNSRIHCLLYLPRGRGSSSVLLCCHGNAFVNFCCRGNKCLLNCCLTSMTSASAIIPALGQCLPSRSLANGRIPSQYIQCTIQYNESIIHYVSYYLEKHCKIINELLS
jgi:hypothetical protein